MSDDDVIKAGWEAARHSQYSGEKFIEEIWRAMHAAIHEPTPAMIDAAWRLPCVDGQEPSYVNVWRAMHAAMLKEQK
jgi:hypothetical protein